MRSTVTYSITGPSLFKKKALSWAYRNFERVSCLDSNGYGGKYSSYECLIAAGALVEITPAGKSLEELQRLVSNTNDWLFGFITYDLKNEIEHMHSGNFDGLEMPVLHFFQPEYVLDIREKEVHIHYLPGKTYDHRLVEMWEQIVSEETVEPGPVTLTIQPRVQRKEYIRTVEQIKSHIERGDIYEMNYCQEFYVENAAIDPLSVYNSLSHVSPAPFSCFYRLGDKYLLSASPERFMKKEGGRLLSQPIKGTIRRGVDAEEDEMLKQALSTNAKECAENVMIVDLVRNDLSRIAVPGTVKVEELFGIYTFRQVHQMISTVSCEPGPGTGFTDILKALFPMGSMTGAPKVRAMQLIEHYEVTRRGLYSGAVGYITPTGDFDFNVVIRSLLYNQSKMYLSFMVGSAITFHSDPEQEYEECLLKAAALVKVLTAGS